MKKIIATVLAAILLTVSSTGAFVQGAASAAGQLKEVGYTNDNGGETVNIIVAGYTDYSIMKLSNPDRIVIDIFNAFAPGKQQYVQAGGSAVKSIRYAQFEPYTARVVLEVNGEPEYGVNKTDSGLVVYFGNVPDSALPPTESTEPTEPVEPSEPTQPTQPATPPPAGSAVKKTLSINKNFNVEYTPGNSVDNVAILVASYGNYKVSRLTGPDRLVLDIPNAKYSAAEKKIDTNGSRVQSVRYAKYGENTARFVLDLTGQADYTVTESKGKLLLTVKQPDYKNITYYNNGDRVYFVLKGAKLTEGDEKLKNLFTESYDKTGLKYTINFPASQADIGNGTFKINDGLVKTLESSVNSEAGTAKLVFTSPIKLKYLVFTRKNQNETVITLLKPAASKDKLVVIDAGHGGSDPGAIYKSVVEKELNLDIAKRLDTLLTKKGVKTYMIRDDDSYVALYERAYIANRMNAALFISIHNNSIDDPAYGGTMTLFCPQRSSAFGGKTFATLVQQQLLGILKTTDRKIIERPNLVVLKATTMPAALAEIAFITNSKDRTNLQSTAFRQKAAQGLYNAVIKALPEVS